MFEVTKEEGLDTDEPLVELREAQGRINSDLTIGADVTRAKPLQANEFICSRGMAIHGEGFIVTPAEAAILGLGRKPGIANHIRPTLNGRDLTGQPRGVMAIDFDGLEIDEVRKRFPEAYQHLVVTVKPEREKNNEEYRRVNWWLFGRRNTLVREFTANLPRYIVTVTTAKHRVFQFLDAKILPDDALVCIGLADAYNLGVLSSRFHTVWAIRAGSWLGIGNDSRYRKSKTFDPFPFPEASDALKAQIRASAEELDALRKQCQAEHPGLTLTQIYNVLEKLRAGEPLNEADEAIKTKGLVLIVKELHDKLDSLVAEAYGWPETLSDEEILGRLVKLNAERAAEEKRGLIRWLRPDYQRPRAGVVDAQAAVEAGAQIMAPLVIEAKAQKPLFPTNDLERTAAVFAALLQAEKPLDAETLAKTFRQGAKAQATIARVLASLARLGHVHSSDGKTFALRRAA